MLGDLGEFVRQLVTLFRTAPPDVVAVVIAGSAFAGFLASSIWRKLRRPTQPPIPAPRPVPDGVTDAGRDLRDCLAETQILKDQLANVMRVIAQLEDDESNLWKLHRPAAPPKFAERLRASRTKVLLIGHLKGGVSKTTLLANLAAYFDRNGKRVLAIDFDYQGSLTATLLRSVGKDVRPPYSDILLNGQTKPSDLVSVAIDLHPKLQRTRLLPASYTLVQKENQLMIRWLLEGGAADMRYRLAELLLSPEVQNAFDIVLIDIGPRLTTASVCALAATTHLVVPTILDQLSAEAVDSFLQQVKAITEEMKTGLDAVSVVGTMTRQERLDDSNRDAIATIRKALNKWGDNAQLLSRNIPFRQVFIDCAGTDIASLTPGDVRTLFDELGNELSGRIGL